MTNGSGRKDRDTEMTNVDSATRTRLFDALRQQRIETPFGRTGTPEPGSRCLLSRAFPRTPEEEIDDAAQVHQFTGVAPTVSLHIPWDKVDDYSALAAHAKDRGVAIGGINANVFQDVDYMLGSVTNPEPGVRRKATDHLLECVEIPSRPGRATSSCGSPTG
jgi:L-rhamnose isomerase/sugar isomerase